MGRTQEVATTIINERVLCMSSQKSNFGLRLVLRVLLCNHIWVFLIEYVTTGDVGVHIPTSAFFFFFWFFETFPMDVTGLCLCLFSC